MIKITSDCDPSLVSPDVKCVQLIVKSVFDDKEIKDAELSYIFCNDDFLSKLKKKFFKKNQFTDVIAFRLNSYEEKEIEGEIYISLPRAKENAKIYEEPYEKEVARLIIHGCLHLLGYSDETKNEKQIMTNLENVFLDRMIWGNYLKMVDKEQATNLFSKLIDIVERLRSPDGCPWDKEQTHESLLPYFLEETYEVIESVESNDWKTLKEELGDVLLHILLQAQIAKESNKFDILDTLNGINKKLINRHPHVFGNKNKENTSEVKKDWELRKHIEKRRESRLDGVPKTLPSLTRAQRLQEKASLVGFDWDNIEPIWDKLYEEIEELKQANATGEKVEIEEEVGDVLFTVVNISRFMGIPAEDMLRKSNEKFIQRFKNIEKELKLKGIPVEKATSKQMNIIWDRIKKSN